MRAAEGKYEPLHQHLLFSGQGQKVMTFAEIEAVLQKPLPTSARRRPEWWSNSSRGHSQAKAWRDAGYRTAGVNLVNETVEFKLENWPEGYVKFSWPAVSDAIRAEGLEETGQAGYASPIGAREHPLFGIWEGRVTLLPEVDYAAPAFESDDAA